MYISVDTSLSDALKLLEASQYHQHAWSINTTRTFGIHHASIHEWKFKGFSFETSIPMFILDDQESIERYRYSICKLTVFIRLSCWIGILAQT